VISEVVVLARLGDRAEAAAPVGERTVLRGVLQTERDRICAAEPPRPAAHDAGLVERDAVAARCGCASVCDEARPEGDAGGTESRERREEPAVAASDAPRQALCLGRHG